MAEIVRMPKLSDTMTEGVVVEWHKKVGDRVATGELLAEIETDKATMDFESFQDGILLHIGVEKGKAAPVDSILAILGKKGENIQPLLEAETKKETPERQKEKATNIPEKKTTAATAPPANTVFPPEPEEQAKKPSVKGHSPKHTAPAGNDNRIKASPLARKLADELSIDLSGVKGTGDEGRITKRDIDKYVSSDGVLASKFIGVEKHTDTEVSQTRRTIARRLSESKFSAPHYYLTVAIDMDRAIDVRNSINASQPVKISFNDLIIKAAAGALRKHPEVNVSWLGEKVRTYGHIHIGIAVAVDEGLVVPVIRFADGKTLTQLHAEINALAEKARSRNLKPAEMQENTFTISNLGMYGIEEFTAIINPPDACIMAIGQISQKPVVKDGKIMPGNMMKVTLSCDHRAVDGATGARFLNTFRQMMENPVLFLGAHAI